MNDLEIHLKKAESAGCYPAAIELSELLQTRDFAFLTASAGEGCDDLYHTGTVAYYVKYSSYEAFKNCFEADYDKKYGELKAEYGSWMSSLDYEDIFLERAWFVKERIFLS